MRSYLGLRARITLVIVLITTATATAVAVAAYRLQAESIEGRFTAAATVGFASDLDQARLRQSGDPLPSTVAYMRGRRGIDWALFDFGQGVAAPVRGVYPMSGATATSDLDSSYGRPLNRVRELPASLVDEARRGGMPRAVLPAEPASVLAFAAYLGSDIVLVEFYDLDGIRRELETLRRDLVLIAVVVAAVGLVAALLAAQAIQHPVRRVAAAARRLGQGELGVRLPVRGRDELADLTRSFNTMAGRLGESIEELTAKDRQQRQFIANVTHDLRTPVAAMIAVVDSLDEADAETRSRSARLLGTQSRRLAKLVEDLLEISRFDAGAADLRPEPVDLHALLEDAIAVTGVRAELRSTGESTVTADPRRLHTIACNLLANAMHHGAEPITVTIDGTEGERVVLRVADSGPGVPPDLAPILFDRFVRGDRSRAATEGNGLGLAIARENALAHGASLEVHHADGAVFTLIMPRERRSGDAAR
ncbi:sensor histidine kinase [Actinophytocola xanthii]|uniref:Signal transduction histidine-protein kinase/phosphatase MprB n=1 Tax=Actinophytocola xanthii TaxID=1912961 RepID=A0A1Q8CY04_9PSEU|nr:HAMP domain-containing sensor histidine kinase [Actinophytocola xanthii]OLF19237.1 hypothetical protein BU204_02485 [Actinophytocola xanthii]